MAKGDNFRSSELLGVLNQVSSAINNSPSNIYINPSVLKEILALDKELSSVLNDLNLTHNEKSRQLLQRLASCSNGKLAIVPSKEGKALCIRSSDSKSQSASNRKSSDSSDEDGESSSSSSSSISLYSTDSIITQKSEDESDHEKKKNLVIRCNYNTKGQVTNKNVVHVFRHDPSCQIPPPLCPDPRCDNKSVFQCKGRRDMERRKRVRRSRSGSRDSVKSKKREEKKEKDKIKKEQKAKEKEKKKKEKEMKDKEKKQQKEKKKEAKRNKSKTKTNKSSSEGSVGKKKKSKKKTKKGESEESVVSGKSETAMSSSSCKAGIQCEIPLIPFRPPKCWFSCKGTQAANTRRRAPSDAQPPQAPPAAQAPQTSPAAPCGRSRFARFLSSFGNGGLQLRFVPPEKPCRSTKSCIIPKLRIPGTLTLDSSCGLPRIKFSRTPEPCGAAPCGASPCGASPCGASPCGASSCGASPCGASPCGPPPCAPPTCAPPPCAPLSCRPPPAKSTPCVRPDPCSKPCKLPRCIRAPSFPRLKPCAIPSCRLKPPCRIKPCLPAPCEQRPCTPPPIPRLCGPRTHTPPPCIPRPVGPFFPPNPKPCSSRPSTCSQPQPCGSVPCSAPVPCGTAPCSAPPPCGTVPCSAPQPCGTVPCSAQPCGSVPCSAPPPSCYSPPCSPSPCASSPCTPRPCDAVAPCTPPPCRSKTPIRRISKCRLSLAGKLPKCLSNTCFSQPCGSPPCTPPVCSSRPCSLCGSRPCTPCTSRPCTPTNPCDPQPCSTQPCGSRPCSTPSCNAHPCNPPPCNPCPPKPCLSKPRLYDPCGPSPNCSRPCRLQPYSCDSQCNVRKWTCCTKRARISRPCSPQRSRVSICEPGPCRRSVFRPRITPISGPAFYPNQCSPRPCGSGRICPHTPRCSDTNVCVRRSSCAPKKCYPEPCRWKPCRSRGYPASPSCSDSDICYPRSSCRSRRCSPPPVCPREDTCYLKRKCERPWWTSKCTFDPCSPRPCSPRPCSPQPCSRSPSCHSLDRCSDEYRYYRRKCGRRRYWSPYCSDDEFCYPRRYHYPPWWRYYPLDGPYCSMENLCYPSYRLPCPPRECVSIPCTSLPCRPRSCSPPRKSLSCTPPSCRTRCDSPCRPRPCSPPPYPPPCMPCPYPPPCPPPYPPPCQPCPPPCPPPPCPPPPCFPPPCPPYPCPPYPSCSPTPCSSRTSVSSCGPHPCGPRPCGRTWGSATCGPTACNQDTCSPCGPPKLQRPRCIRSPPCLKKVPQPCGGKPCAKRCFAAKTYNLKPCGTPICPPKTCSAAPSCAPSPCGSPTPSCGNVRYPCYPTPSCSSYGSNYWPYPSPSYTYPPYGYWPNYYGGYGGYPSCYPSQTYSGPGCSLLPKLCLSKLRCSKICHVSCESGLPRFDNSRSSSVSSVSSCSSSKSSLSSSGSSYSSRSSSSSSSTSRTSPNYCVASCRNSKTNFFKCRQKVSNSSICSSSDGSPRRTICNRKDRCHPRRQPCGSPLPCCDSPPPLYRTNSDIDQGPICAPPIPCRLPVHCARSQVCSSATDVLCESRLRCKGIDHYDDRIKFELQRIGINQLIQASKPAKCCKQTVLNQPSREELPYAASLASLPLDRADIRVIRQSVRMATKKTDCNYTSLENRTKLVYYANLVMDDFDTKKPKLQPEYQVNYFYFTLDDAENVQDTLKKSFNRGSTFKFFQIFNWSDKTIQELNKGSSSLKLDLAKSLELKKCITTKNTEDTCVISSGGNSTDALENIVFSDLFLVNQSGVGDSQPGNTFDESCINEFKQRKARKKNHKLNMNFTMTESSFDKDSLVESVRNHRKLDIGSLDSLGKIKSASPNKSDASSQTDITKESVRKHSSDAAAQTTEEGRDFNHRNITFSEEIMRLLSSDGDSVEYLKKNTNCLVFTSDGPLETDSLEVHLKSGLLKKKTDTSEQSNDEEFKNATQNFDDAIKDVLGEIKQLATMAESFKCRKLGSGPKSKDYMTQSTVCSTCSSKPPFEDYQAPPRNEVDDDQIECNEIVQKQSSTTIDLSRKQISKGQFIVRMYNSINEVIGEIYGEAEKLAKLRKNRLAISGISEHFQDTPCKKAIRHYDVEKASPAVTDGLIKDTKRRELRNTFDNLKTVYTSAGKIVTKFYNSKGKAVKSIYNPEGERIAETSSPKKLARMLFDNSGNFVPRYCDSQGNVLKAVYDSQSKLLQKTFNSEMLLVQFPSEDRKKKSKRIFNAQGLPICQFYSDGGKLLTSVYDFEGRLIRGTFLGSITQLFPRIFDKRGKFILGRYNGSGKLIKRIFDSHGNNVQQLYRADRTIMQKAPVKLRILNQKGEPLRKFFRKNKIPLTHVYDVLGNLLCQASDGNSKDLFCHLFDLDGFFILGRLDELRHRIDAVYDENGKKVLQVQVLDSETGDMIKMSKLYNSKGKLLVNFYDESGACLKSIHDVKGEPIECSPSGRATKLAGRMFDMAGHFIHGRYDASKNLIREIYDQDGYKILQVYDVSGKPVRRIPLSNRIFNSNGKQIKHLYKSDHKILSSIYDANGDMIGGVLSIDAEELAPHLFDIEGKFINSRYDSQMNLIKHVYDSKENLLNRVYTQGSLSLKSSKSLKDKPKPVKTVYVKLESKEKPALKETETGAVFESHCKTFPKAILPPLTLTKILSKSKDEVVPSRKRKREEEFLGDVKQLVSVKCQCKMREKKENEKRIPSAPNTKSNNQKKSSAIAKSQSSHLLAKKKKMEKKQIKKGSKKPENAGKNRGEHHNEHRRTTTSLQNPHSIQAKVLATILPCYETTRTTIPRNDDSLESLLDDYLQQNQKRDNHRHTRKNSINYEMIEDTLLECLNLTRHPNSLKRMSHTILQYFTHVVFNQIKNNYYKQISRKRKCSWGRRQDPTVLFLNRKYACAYALYNSRKRMAKETEEENNDTNDQLRAVVNETSDNPQLDDNPSNEEMEETSDTTIYSYSSHDKLSTKMYENAPKDAFLCNLPNAPPFILKMNKATPETNAPVCPEDGRKPEIADSSMSLSTADESFDIEDISSSLSSTMEKQYSTYTEIPDFNVFIDGNCPGFEDQEFKKFVAKSITWIRTEEDKRQRRPRGIFMSTPTICMTGLTNISNNPFGTDDIDSRRPGKHSESFPNSGVNSYHYQSKIPRMLHPGKCKVHAKMKNVQLSPGSKGCAANKSSACGGPCPADKTDIQINPYVKVSVSTTCPSLTNASASGASKGGGKQGGKNKNANMQSSQSSMGDCMKGIKSDPGCYCGNEPIEPTPCPIRLREDCECVEEEAEAQTAETDEDEALCYCPPGEQPLLMKKSNVECDCANRRRCEDNMLVEPPKEKPDVFWALTKVSLLKDGTKNFEIIDVSPVPPGYYLMPDVNNLVLVGPQPKPAKAAPSKNCCCK